MLSILLHATVIGAIMWEPAEPLPDPAPVEAIEVEIVQAEPPPEPPAPEPEPTLEDLQLNLEESEQQPSELEALATDATPAAEDAPADGDPEQSATADGAASAQEGTDGAEQPGGGQTPGGEAAEAPPVPVELNASAPDSLHGEPASNNEGESEAPSEGGEEGEAPETETPEPEAPETDAPETDAPESEAPETEAPETEAPETDAPEREAPEPEAPETEVETASGEESGAPDADAIAQEPATAEEAGAQMPDILTSDAPAADSIAAPGGEAVETGEPAEDAAPTDDVEDPIGVTRDLVVPVPNPQRAQRNALPAQIDTTQLSLSQALRAALAEGLGDAGGGEAEGARSARVAYTEAVRSAIAPRFWHEMRTVGASGLVVVEIVILRNGTVQSARIVDSSDSGELDNAALTAARIASYPPFPQAMQRDRLTVHIPLRAR